MLRFWNRLIKMNNTCLTKRIFLWCHDNPGNTYCEDIMKISNTLNLSPIYHAKGIFNIENIKQSCKELMKIEWQQEIQSKPKLRTYKLMKENFEVESYVAYHVPKNYLKSLGSTKNGNFTFHIETGRYKNVFDRETGNRKMNVNERTCNVCKLDIVEDEKHFLFNCNIYYNERREFYEECATII